MIFIKRRIDAFRGNVSVAPHSEIAAASSE